MASASGVLFFLITTTGSRLDNRKKNVTVFFPPLARRYKIQGYSIRIIQPAEQYSLQTEEIWKAEISEEIFVEKETLSLSNERKCAFRLGEK
jgi:hypothetical protein